MSSLLRHNQRKAQHGGGNATPRLLPRAASSNIRPSGGGGQLLIQRPVHQQKQQHQQQPQQRVQGVISMAEGAWIDGIGLCDKNIAYSNLQETDLMHSALLSLQMKTTHSHGGSSHP